MCVRAPLLFRLFVVLISYICGALAASSSSHGACVQLSTKRRGVLSETVTVETSAATTTRIYSLRIKFEKNLRQHSFDSLALETNAVHRFEICNTSGISNLSWCMPLEYTYKHSFIPCLGTCGVATKFNFHCDTSAKRAQVPADPQSPVSQWTPSLP